MIFQSSVKAVEKFLADNSTAILTGIGVVGSISASYLTGRATIKAVQIVDQAYLDRSLRTPGHETPGSFTKFEIVKMTWQSYLPAAGTLGLTVTCIICANRIGTRRTAAMAAAYKISEGRFVEYKEKVLEKLGVKKEQDLRDEIMQKRTDDNPPCSSDIVIVGDGQVLCYDSYSGRYFQSSMEDIKKAQNDTNYEILHNSYCSLGDFYQRLGLPSTRPSEEVGWNTDHLLEVEFSTTMADNGKPCLCIDFHVAPIRRYHKFD